MEHLLCSFLDSTAWVMVMSIDWLITPDIIFCNMYFEVVHAIAKLFLLQGCLSIWWCSCTFDEWCEQRCLCRHNFVENYWGTSTAHEHYILNFSVLKKDHSLFAIGGPWNAAFDGGDPSLDCSCLIRSAIRYVLIKKYIMDYSYNGDVTFI
jgi:hypothetical protein